MQRLLTGYAVSFNRRHRRHGQLFQNRYKSILCQEDVYLLELVRYIHLNPLRAKLIDEFKHLDKFPYSGHGTLMGKPMHEWQDCEYILSFFGNKLSIARRRYSEFVQKGIPDGRRHDLTGGGLLRSAGGWAVVKSMRRSASRIKGDERILGDGDFVETVLKASQEELDHNYKLQAHQYSFQWLVERVARLFDISRDELLCGGKYPITVKARSVVCFWGNRELGISTVELAKHLNISQPTVSQSVVRGQKIVQEYKLDLFDHGNQ